MPVGSSRFSTEVARVYRVGQKFLRIGELGTWNSFLILFPIVLMHREMKRNASKEDPKKHLKTRLTSIQYVRLSDSLSPLVNLVLEYI